jgi:putative ABC transport system permease protein
MRDRSSGPPRPLPRVVHGLLDVCLRGRDREEIVGDLEENWGGRPLWLSRQVMGVIWHAARNREERSMSVSAVELRHAVRTVASRPGLALGLIGSLGGGIALATVMFSVLNAVLLAPLPYGEPAKLVAVWEHHVDRRDAHEEFSPPNYLDLRERNHTLEGVAAIGDGSVNLTGTGEAERLRGETVTWNYLQVLGIGPALGRGFEAADEQEGSPLTAIISARLWARRFQSDPAIIGRGVRLDDRLTTIVGVMGSDFVSPGGDADVWLPMRFFGGTLTNRTGHFLRVVARLREGTSAEAARADLDRVFIDLEREVGGSERNLRATVVSLREQLSGAYRPTLRLLFGAVSFVLLMACANAANLLLARASVRQREMAIRVALGADRARLRGLLLTESLLVAAVAGSLGLLLSVWGVAIVNRLLPESMALAAVPGSAWTLSGDAVAIALDWRVLAFAVATTIATGLLFGLIPAQQMAGVSASDVLRQTRTTGGVRARTRKLLVVAQLATAVMLLVATGLLLRSVVRLHATDPGFDSRNVVTLRTVLSPQAYATPAARQRFFDAVLERVSALPGVESAGYVTFLPLTFDGLGGGVAIESRPIPNSPYPLSARYRMVTRDYLPALRIPLLAGRNFSAADSAQSPKVALVSESFARALWKDDIGRAVGQRVMMFGSPTSTPERWLTVVGVVGSVRQTRLDAAPPLEVYALQAQGSPFAFAEPRDLAVRVSASAAASPDPLSLAPALRAIVREVDPEQPITDVRMLSDIVRHGTADRRAYLGVIGAFAVLTLALAIFGLTSVMSYVISARRSELSLRLALGALPGQLIALVAREVVTLMSAGLAIGVVGALLGARAMRAWLYETPPTDLLTMTIVILAFVISCVLSCALPLWRATKLDPGAALRAE